MKSIKNLQTPASPKGKVNKQKSIDFKFLKEIQWNLFKFVTIL